MKIRILAFGIAKDILGSSPFEIDVPKATKAYALKVQLLEQFPAFGKLNSFQIAINANYANDNDIIKEHDEVVLIPPVSGG